MARIWLNCVSTVLNETDFTSVMKGNFEKQLLTSRKSLLFHQKEVDAYFLPRSCNTLSLIIGSAAFDSFDFIHTTAADVMTGAICAWQV